MQIAAIDIGTNSIHMIVVRVGANQSFEIIDREKEMVRLGAGGLGGRLLTSSARAAALEALGRFRRLADSRKVDQIIATATSAVREATNGSEFLRAIERKTGIHGRVISGAEEARLIHAAAVHGVDLAGGTAVVIDIGGGSTEITLGTADGVRMARSFKLGTIRLTEQFVHSDPLSRRDERALVRQISTEVSDYLREIRQVGFSQVIGSSGTILSVGALALERSEEDASDELHHRRVPAKQIHRIRTELVARDAARRLKLPGLDPRRADLIVAGGVLIDTLLRCLGADELTLCGFALREGLVLDYIRRNPAQIAQADRYPDIRPRSVIELAERCRYAPEHAQQVARLALAIFDHTRRTHQLSSRARDWLEYAALLHDIGVHISYERHHRHSYYLIKNGDLRGFDPDEIETIALIARYHRRARPKKSHQGYNRLGRLQRRAVLALSAMLRVAESLDRSHAQLVDRLEVVDEHSQIFLRVHSGSDVELEAWVTARQLAALQAALGKDVRLEVVHAAEDRPRKTVPSDSPARRASRLPAPALRHSRLK